jgi:hypothetical protein
MKRIFVVVAVVVASFLVFHAWAAESKAGSESTTPPKNLKKVGDHWTPWDPPAAGPSDYIIQPGDCLWNLAGKWLGNPYLWPQIWDQNKYVLDSHWIYPGDPLVVPGKPTVVPPGGPPPTTGAGESAEAPVEEAPPVAARPARPAVPTAPVLVPIADPAEVYCSGYIDPDHKASDLRVAGLEERVRENVATGDIIYLNHGADQGIQPGAVFQILRPSESIVNPATRKKMGRMIRRMGRARVLAVQDKTSTLVIDFACEGIVAGDEMTPWEEIPIPRLASLPDFDRFDSTPSGQPSGTVVMTRDNIAAVGEGYIAFVDLGSAQDVKPGDVMSVFRHVDELPRRMLGQAVVVETREGSSMVKITKSLREIYIGDKVEIER